MHVCFVTEDFYPSFIGGQGIYGKNLVSVLSKTGIKVTVLAEKRGGLENYWKNAKNIQLILVPFCFGNQLILAFLEYCFFILRCSNQYFDILHTNQLTGLFFVLFKPKNVGSVIASVHNTYYDMRRETTSFWTRLFYLPLIFLERIVYTHADGLLFNSPYEKKQLFSYVPIGDKPHKIVYLGIEAVNYNKKERLSSRQTIRRNLNLPQEAKIVLYVGRLVKRKKIDTLIRALQKPFTRPPLVNVVGIIIGEGSERKNLERSARRHRPNIYFLGFVSDTRDYFLASDIFVTTSVAEGGFSLSVVEAASFGLPLIISSSVAGFPIVKQGVNGYVIDPNNQKELAEKIQLILPRASVMGKESLKLVRPFTWDRCARETLNFYQSLLEKDSRIS